MICDLCSRPAVALLAISRDDPTGLKRIEVRTRRCEEHRDVGIQRRDRVRTIKSAEVSSPLALAPDEGSA